MAKEYYLKKYMNSVPAGDYKRIKDLIIKKCHITDDIWNNWLSGRTLIPELAKSVIIKVAKQNIFNQCESIPDK